MDAIVLLEGCHQAATMLSGSTRGALMAVGQLCPLRPLDLYFTHRAS
jgi:hypothetical protein